MATTTNYGWTTPDDTALVKDGASAIRTLGSSVDTTTKALNPETTLGDLAYRSSTANVKTRLGLGTAGQVLQVNSGATAPEWATPSSGGMTLISTTTLSGASVTLSSIPATYNNLQIVIRLPLLSADNNEVFIRFNADSTANRHLGVSNFTSVSNASFGSTRINLTSGIDNAVTQGIITLTIPDYANTSTWKFGHFLSFTNNATTTTNTNFQAGQVAYNQTGAISSLEFTPGGAGSPTFTSGSILLYGVK